MKNIDRREWLKTAGLASTFTFLSGFKGIGEQGTHLPDLLEEQADSVVQLNANENPYGPSEKVREAIIQAFGKGCRYPFRFSKELIKQLAEREGVSEDHIVLTAGSTEGLRLTGLTFGIHGGEIIAADPTFQALMSYAKKFGAHINRVPIDQNLVHDLDEMEKRINSNTRLIFICNPNNPTGTLLPPEKLEDFCSTASKRTLIFSDEAYYDFIEDKNYPSMVGLVKKGYNVIVSRTFSKVYGLAGIRVGYQIARPDIAQRLRDNMVASANVLGIYAALAAMKDQEFYKLSLQRNIEAKQHIYKTLDDLNLEYVKSQTNFIFFKTDRDIQKFILQMRAEGVEVGRPFPPLTQWCRISTGTMEAMEKFGTGLKKVMV